MEKKRITRAEVSSLLIKDAFYEKGKPSLKLRQTIIAVLAWLGVLLPFVWLALPFVAKDISTKIHFLVYKEELQTLRFLVIFLTIAFLFIAVLYISLTFWNNHRFKKAICKDVVYDTAKLAARKAVLEEAYTHRFGEADIRHTVRYYSVSEAQNLDKDFVKKLYKDQGVSL